MYAAKISVSVEDIQLQHSLAISLEALLRSWRTNGQILGKEQPVFLNHNELIATAIIPEEDSLEALYNTEDARSIILTIGETEGAVLDIKIVGISPYGIAACECEKPGSYILYTNYASLSPPIRCGDCSFPVPLYKIPTRNDEERNRITLWQASYQSCDMLHVNSAIGEQFSQRQVQHHDSPLAKEGRDICSKIEEHTEIPTFYYLSKPGGKSLKQEKKRTCPSCKNKWLLKESWHDIFDFKCESCRLLSNIGWTVRSTPE